MAPALDALTRPIAVTGFMGAGKSTVGRLLALRLGRPFADADAAIERRAGCSVRALFERDGEAAFRALEETVTRELLLRDDAPVIALGGGALLSGATRALVRERAFCAWLDVPFAVAWERVDGAPGARPLAGDRVSFEQLGARRAAQYAATADAIVAGEGSADSVAGALAQQVWTRTGLARVALGEGAVAIVDGALDLPRSGAAIAVEGGEEAKSLAGLERLWRALAEQELERGDVVVCVGGGSVTDVGGFAAATFRRGVPWLAVPSTLVGQVDAAIGGKTAINVAAKNDVGAFWQPSAVLCDPDLLETLPPREWAGGMGEVVKTALLVGGRLWELVQGWEPGPGDAAQRSELVQRCAGVKTLVVADDPEDRGRRAILNLGHTIGHGIESVAGYGGLSHGECVAIGLVAALRLSERLAGLPAGTADETAQLLERQGLPVEAPGLDPDAVLAAMRHDKKRTAGTHRMVLLEAIGRPVYGVAVGEDVLTEAVRAATRLTR
ncbi:MAG: shikimate kinase / 3-dehydroquinate synthase [Gaiellales bacterium]|nr:shikimate kinase / 3-dehydroquinate synthase [Gaiellales bacterium]